ncbi:hypothetical protein [Salibacterium lacus]|uniref:Glycosyl hydrolase n=1 Tax=Salibacterium lacus TaxID=1898109 RepID=A0ABW5T5D8_9BACI
MTKKRITLWTVLLFVTAVGLIYAPKDSEKAVDTVEKHYTNDYGMIHAYPDDPASSYLSESAGLYMQYLNQTKNKKAFAEQADLVSQYFVTQDTEQQHIKWRLENTTANALIDDVRIIDAMVTAASLFETPAYKDLADQWTGVLADTQQQNGIYVDYYDWKRDNAASRITLSYITPELTSVLPDTRKTEHILTNLDRSGVFFPKYYDTGTKSYHRQDEVNMIDQLLIALNRLHAGASSPAFHKWIIQEWQQNRLYGRYDRDTLDPAVEYEALAVYALFVMYLQESNAPGKAQEVEERMQALKDEMNPDNLHFFDYIYDKLAGHYEKERKPQ